MSLNFSIDSILRHSSVESTNADLLVKSNKLDQSNFLNQSTSALLKKQQYSYLTNNNLSSTISNLSETEKLFNSGLNNQINDSNNNNDIFQSPHLYLNKNSTNTKSSSAVAALSLMDVQKNLNNLNNTSSLSLDLNQLDHIKLNQLNHFQNQLNRYHYLQKFNTFYNNDQFNPFTSNINKNIVSSTSSCRNDNQSSKLCNKINFNNFQLNLNNQVNNKNIDNLSSLNSSTTFFSNNGTALLSSSLSTGLGCNESQCSPLSDKSSELLNYEDSSDSNRMSQNSGNNLSINSSNSNLTNQANLTKNLNSSFNNFNNKDSPLCTKCKLHGIKNQVKGHKKNCPKKDCGCELCVLTDYGKRLRGKKSKKQAILSSVLNSNNLLKQDNETGSIDNNLFSNNATTPNSNSNSSCSNVSMSAAAALAITATSLRNNNQTTTLSLNNDINNSTQISSNHNFSLLSKSAIKEYLKIVINLLKEKLAQDGLSYEQELSNLKFAVIYLLLNRFDKNELYNRFLMNAQ